jgi:transposase
MSMKPELIGPIPAETERVARAAFPKGNRAMQMRDRLGGIYDDARFTDLFAVRGRPAEAPWRLAVVTVLQFAEGLSDRQAADAVRGRIDWKYLLALPLEDPGFDFSVLSEFRTRLVEGNAEHLLLDALLDTCKAHGLLRARGRQRTDSTHVLGALRALNRLEQVAETVRAALEAVAEADSAWLQAHAPAEWFVRYQRRIEDYRLPQGQQARADFARQVGEDGMTLLTAVFAPDAPPSLRTLGAIEILRRTWIQRYLVWEGHVRLREPQDRPPASDQIVSPYETEARYATKRAVSWVGYKSHLTETCDDDLPHLLTQVETTIAPAADVEQLGAIQEHLAATDLLPAEHLVDTGYVRTGNLVASQRDHQIDLIGPIYEDRAWQAKADDGFALAQFQIDWDAQVVTCPQGRQSVRWESLQDARHPDLIHVGFSRADCSACPVRPRCTRSKTQARTLTLRPRAEHDALLHLRQRQTTAEFRALYGQRAGIEGTISQGVRVSDLRQARYRGLAKTHLQHVATAVAINLDRLDHWFTGLPRIRAKPSRLATLASLNG